jgi:hypothetical protein
VSDDPFASAAQYRAKGWVGTLPLPRAKKTPPPKGFTGDGGVWPSTADIAAWSETGPQNIALRLPPNVIALDVDDLKAFAGLVELVGPLPPTWRAHSGGERVGHFYYRLPPGVVSTDWGAPCPGVDLLRFGHRYSVVAPSLHPSGTRYAWARPDGTDAGTDLPGPGDLPELPAAWVDYLGGEGTETSTTFEGSVRDSFGDVGEIIPSGRHQEALFQHACSMRARGVPESEAAAVIRHRAAHDCTPPWKGPDDPWHAVKHAYVKYEAGAPLDAPWPAYDAAVEALVNDSAPINNESLGERFTFLDWRALAATPPEPVDWYVPGVIAAGRGHVLYSATGIGKSLISLEWCVDMVRRGLTVLYVDHENDPRRDIWELRLVPMRVEADELDRLRYLSFPEMGPLDRPEGGAELLAIALEAGADIVVVDTATRTVKGEENSNDTWTAWDRNTGVKLRRAGIGFLRIDHSGKDSDKGQRGGSNKATDVDLVWRLELTGEDEFVLTNEKARIPVPEKVIALRRERVPNLHHARIEPPSRLTREAAKMREIWAAMDSAGVEIDPTDDLGHPKGVRKLATEVRDLTGAEGRHELLSSVAKARWASVHNAFAERPDWAPPLSELGEKSA